MATTTNSIDLRDYPLVPASTALTTTPASSPISPIAPTKRKWGVFEELADKKRRIDEECKLLETRIKTIMDDTVCESPLRVGGRGVNQFIDETTDHYISELETYLVSDLGWTGMRLRHACPICRTRIIGKPFALFCGHVFCRACIGSLVIPTEERSVSRSESRASSSTTGSMESEDDTQYLCGICRSVSGGVLKLYF